jgi:hypothetical protein
MFPLENKLLKMKKALILILSVCLMVFVLGFILINSENKEAQPPAGNFEFKMERHVGP